MHVCLLLIRDNIEFFNDRTFLKTIFRSETHFLKTDFFSIFCIPVDARSFHQRLLLLLLLSSSFNSVFSQTFIFLKNKTQNNNSSSNNNGSCQVQIYPQKRQICPALFESLPVALFKSRARFRFRNRKFKNAFQPVTAKTFDFRSSCNGRWPRRPKRPERPELR